MMHTLVGAFACLTFFSQLSDFGANLVTGDSNKMNSTIRAKLSNFSRKQKKKKVQRDAFRLQFNALIPVVLHADPNIPC